MNIQVFSGAIAGKEQTLTTSRIVGEVFGRRHRDVLRAIDNLDCSHEFTERNFALSEYKDPTGRPLREFRMTRDGFMFLVMGFTGSEAARRKEAFIAAFNELESRLVHRPETPEVLDRAMAVLAELATQVKAQGAQIERLTRGLVSAKDSELRLRRQISNEEIQRRIDRVIMGEAEGMPRDMIASDTGLSLNYIRQIVHRAKRDGHLPADEAQRELSL